MKKIRDKILFVVIILLTIPLLAVGITGIWLNYSSTVDTLYQTMEETAVIAAERVSREIEAYLNVAIDAGCMTRLANSEGTVEGKKEIIDQRMKTHGFVRGNVIGKDGVSLFDGNNYSDREYFQQAMKGNTWISEPLVSKVTGVLTVIIAAPIWENGIQNTEVVGVVYFVPPETFLNDIVKSINVSEHGLAYMLDGSGYTIAHENMDNVTNRENTVQDAASDSSLKALAALEQRMVKGETGRGGYRYGGVSKVMAFAPVEGTNGWSIAVNAPKSDFMSSTYQGILWTAVITAAALLAAAFFALRLANGIGKPIRICTERLKKLADGDLQSEVEQINTKDETKELSEATEKIADTLKGVVEDMAWGLGEVANGNLLVDSKKKELYVGDLQPLAVAMYSILDKLNGTLHQINVAAEQVAGGAAQVSDGAQVLSRGATEQASSVEELAATINEISGYSGNTAERTQEADKQAKFAGDKVELCNHQMQDMLAAMEDIRSKSDEIRKIIKTIEDIAFQTNILALNAAVEAARAGTAGKGFAVVADEVRNLASKSAEASKNTAALIDGTVKAVENGFGYANETADSLSEIVVAAKAVSDGIREIASDAREQASSISQVTTGIEQISGVVQSNSATAEESAAASEELSGQAEMLKELVGRFRLKKE